MQAGLVDDDFDALEGKPGRAAKYLTLQIVARPMARALHLLGLRIPGNGASQMSTRGLQTDELVVGATQNQNLTKVVADNDTLIGGEGIGGQRLTLGPPKQI